MLLSRPHLITLLALCLPATLLAQEAQNLPPFDPSEEQATPPAPVSPAPGAGAGPQPPQFTPVRWNEDWSYLRDQRRTALEQIKFIPLARDGDVYLSLGGQGRYRYEVYDNLNFGAGPQDGDGYHLFRFMAHADLHVSENLRFFLQGISALSADRQPGPRPGVDENRLDIHQGFADLRLPVIRDDNAWLTLRAGRQNLIYGAQRLISPLDWTNTRRTFDGGRASFTYEPRGSSVDIFYVRPVIVERGPLDEFFSPDAPDFAGIYNTLVLPELVRGAGGTRFEQYLLYLDRDNAPFFQAVGDERRFTLGGRFYTNPAPWDFDVEAAYQFGTFDSPAGEGDISAFFVAGEAGYTFADAPLTPRLFAGGTWASGDDDPDDADLGTFNQLYPLAHAYLAYADVLGRQNVLSLYGGTELTLFSRERRWARRVTLQGTYHAFWRASRDDAIYTVGGAPGRAGGEARFIAHELDCCSTGRSTATSPATSASATCSPATSSSRLGPATTSPSRTSRCN